MLLKSAIIEKIGICFIILAFAGSAIAANPVLPSSADAGRVDRDHKQQVPSVAPEAETPNIAMPQEAVPKGASKIKFKLEEVTVEGVKAFPKKEIEGLYRQYLNQEITLDTVWKIADLITQYYQEKGYFLAQAFVPQQKIKDGRIIIKVVEGYIGEVELYDPVVDNSIVQSLIEKLKSDKPARSATLESVILRLNDLPGVSFSATVQKLSGSKDGAVKLIITKETKKATGFFSFDNFNSRYLGPYEGTISYQAVLLSLQQTSVSFLGGIPVEKLKYFSMSHEVPLTADISVQLYGGYTKANPGFTLSSRDIDSNASNLGIILKDQFIRQRTENLSGTLSVDGKNNYSDVLEAPLTRDRVRAVRINISYDRDDPLDGYDYTNLTLSQGLEILDSSTSDQEFLSRSGAKPNFTKLEYGVTRFQGLGEEWMAVAGISGQIAGGVLYSSEQFGYGGQAFGRAYDPSEIVGDNGIAGSLEFRYTAIPAWQGINFSPYGFYDIGKVWNNDETPSSSGSSAGGGIRFAHTGGLAGNFLVGKPLTRPLTDPSSGNGKSLRYLFQISYKF